MRRVKSYLETNVTFSLSAPPARHFRPGSGHVPAAVGPCVRCVQVRSDLFNMLKVFQVSVLRALRRGACFPEGRVRAAGGTRFLTRQPCSAARHSVRSSVRSCTVDPNLEEEFVFVEYAGETPRGGSRQVEPVKDRQEWTVCRRTAETRAEPNTLLSQ